MAEIKPNNAPKPEPSFLSKTWEFFHDLIDLKDGLDKEGTIINIKSNKEMQGANAWLLMCSIFIASLGLDLNSPAVIIGAMLISPLMAPILGIGLGIGINDRNTLEISGYHLLIAIGIALFTSTLYFVLSGHLGISGGFTDEIKGRTSPSILDAMVALIGGLAGIISSSRKDKSNAIPGVAIATALMPPLCVTGYGIAHLFFGIDPAPDEENLRFTNIVWNSFFLFFLNATLVALATYLIVRFMDFPSRSFTSVTEERRSKIMLYCTSFFLLSISLYTTYNIVTENTARKNIQRFVNENLSSLKLVEYDVEKNIQTGDFNIEVDLLETLTKEECDNLTDLLASPKYNVPNGNIMFNYPDEKKLTEIAQKSGENLLLVRKEIREMEVEIDSLSSLVKDLETQNKKERESKIKFIARANFTNLEDIKYYLPNNESNAPMIALKWNQKIKNQKRTRVAKEKQLVNLVKDLMEVDSLEITYLPD